jgi:hypothetical protein
MRTSHQAARGVQQDIVTPGKSVDYLLQTYFHPASVFTAAFCKIRDYNRPHETGNPSNNHSIYLGLIGQWPWLKTIEQTTHDNDRVNKGRMVGQKKNRSAIRFYIVQTPDGYTVTKPKYGHDENIEQTFHVF